MTPEQAQTYIENVRDLIEDEAIEQTRLFIEAGEDPLEIINKCEKGMIQVGRLYEKGEYFISSLIVAGEIFKQVAQMVQPLIKHDKKTRGKGSILLGTVHGDIHDLGKNLFGLLMECHGFTVHDIGVDVPTEEFCIKAAEIRPDIIGLSGLLTVAYDSMQETVAALKQHKDKTIARIPVIIRSTSLMPDINQSVGAEYHADSAMSGVNLCKQIIKQPKNKK